MKATIDISLYPLTEDYKRIITEFIRDLHSHPEIRVETDGMRTQIIGDYDDVLEILKDEMKSVLQSGKAVFNIKLAKGERTKENLSIEF